MSKCTKKKGTVTYILCAQEVAASPPNVEGLSTPSVNISYGLDLILKEDWKSDREFQEAVALLLDKVQDAHLVKL